MAEILSPARTAAAAVCSPIATTTGGVRCPNVAAQARAAEPLANNTASDASAASCWSAGGVTRTVR